MHIKFIKWYLSTINTKDLSSRIKVNVILSSIIKGLSVIISFMMIRISYDYLKSDEIYGIWLTILSILSWINIFDIGLGNGLRNKLTESIATNKQKISKVYVSTTYAMMSIMIIIILIIYFLLSKYINWNNVFNTTTINMLKLRFMMSFIISLYLIRFVISIINSISLAFQNSYLPPLLNLVSNTLVLLLLYIFGKIGTSSIVLLSIIYSASFIIVLLTASIYLFHNKYSMVRPSFHYIKFKYAKNLLDIGLKFFFIQIFTLIIFTTDNMIILQVLGPEYVAEYQIAFKLFNVFIISADIILASLWSAYTHMYTIKNYDWIIKALKRLMILMVLVVIGVIIMITISDFVIDLWMGNRIGVNKKLIVYMGIYAIERVWFSIFAQLANGINRLKMQLITYIIAGAINIPISIYFADNMKLGSAGVILGTIVSLSIFSILGPIDLINHFSKLTGNANSNKIKM